MAEEQVTVDAFERIVIAVPSLVEASTEYRQLLGMEAAYPGPAAGPRAWFPFSNTVIELAQSAVESAQIRGIVLGAAGAAHPELHVANSRGLDIYLGDGSSTADFREQGGKVPGQCFLVDHLVLRTADADACIDLFGRRLGIRLALDKTVPQWGGRMLFFRTGKITLEIIEPQREKPDEDYFWGIAYQCRDLQQTARQLAGRGVELSPIRAGRKPGSFVATVKSHCLGIPTLLLQPPRPACE